MATVTNPGSNQVRLDNGQQITAQMGGWYDGQQYWGGTLGAPGQFNSQNNQAGQQGAAPVQNQADASYLQSRGDSTAGQRVVSQPQAPAPAPMPNGSGVNFSGMASSRPNVDLMGVYNKALNDANITGLQSSSDAIGSQIATRRQALLDATGKINDNPFYSEATRVGRVAKLNDAAQGDINNFVNQQTVAESKVAAAKADAQVKLGIATNQYNIDDKAYQDNLNMVNQLLTSGALNNASGQDIGQIAASTGLSTSMVQSIIDTSKSKNVVKPQLITIDDGQNQSIVAVDANGNVISKNVIGGSAKTSGGGGAGSKQDMQGARADMAGLISASADTSGKKNPQLTAGGDGKLSPQSYDYYRQVWVNQGYSAKDFELNFGYLKNPSNPYY